MLLCAATLAFASLAQIPNSPDIKVTFALKHSSKKDVYDAKTVYPQFSGDSAVAKLATKEVAAPLDSQLEFFMVAVDDYETADRPKVGALYFEAGAKISIAKTDFVSLYTTVFDFAGGAHPNTVYQGMTWGIVDGKARRLKFADLLKKGEDPVAVASAVVVPKLVKAAATWFKEGDKTKLDPKMVENFVVTKAGVTWIFSPYDAGPYVDGEFFIKVPWSELKGHLKE
ncbi:MAG TPA: DUF3298 domain-containing protein [Fimbriimonadaceae bacterium]|nr:DUF3298 domain-containing protein [Fimbriimonadaceae bacterium]